MPKYLLLKHYRGGPEPHRPVPPMDQWEPEDVEAHIAFQRHVSELIKENGEYVDVQALTPVRTWVRYGGPDAAPVTTDGPLPEVDIVDGVPDEYVAASTTALGADQVTEFERQVRSMYDQMARISIEPVWARFFDFGAGRMPSFVTKLAGDA